MITNHGRPLRLPKDLAPGEETELPLHVTAPKTPALHPRS